MNSEGKNWIKLSFNKFGGYETQTDQSLMSNETLMAVDICNFRVEKVGKLVTRDGYIFGLHLGDQKPYREVEGEIKLYENIGYYVNNIGIVGIAEYALSEYWDAIDTDRLMVYAINGSIEEDGQKRYVMVFLFSPITGRYKDMLLIPSEEPGAHPYGDFIRYVSYSYLENPQGDPTDPNEVRTELIGRKREFATDDTHWIEQFIDMKQYQNKLVISDRLNGDLILEDEYDLVLNPQCPELSGRVHRLVLRSATLFQFDINDVEISNRTGTGEENDGLKTGMALYKFKAKKGTTIASNGAVEVPLGSEPGMSMFDNALNNSVHKTFIRGAALFDKHLQRLEIKVDTKNTYYFTNAETSGEEFDDLSQPVELDYEEVLDENGNVVKERIADVYRWEDYKIPYYLCSSFKLNDRHLNEANKIFDKMRRGVRVQKLKIKDKYGRDIPLGVYKYRFVWDFGNGVYSAPSSELVIPDLLWSATPDDELIDNGIYKRDINFKGVDIARKDSPVDWQSFSAYNTVPIAVFYDPPKTPITIVKYVRLFSLSNGIINITNYGKRFFDLKKKLYENMRHKYGTKSYTDYSSYDDIDYNDFINDPDISDRLGDLGCILTVFTGKNLTTSGYPPFFYTVIMRYNSDKPDENWGTGGRGLDQFYRIDRDNHYYFKVDKDLFETRFKRAGMWTRFNDKSVKTVIGQIEVLLSEDLLDVRNLQPIFDDGGRFIIACSSNENLPYCAYRDDGFDPEVKRLYVDATSFLYINLFIRLGSPLDLGDLVAPSDIFEGPYNGYYYLWDDFCAGGIVPDGPKANLVLERFPQIKPNSPGLAGQQLYSMIRGCKVDSDMLGNINTNVPNEARDRLILNGIVPLEVLSSSKGDKVAVVSNVFERVWSKTNKKEPFEGYHFFILSQNDEWKSYYNSSIYPPGVTLPNDQMGNNQFLFMMRSYCLLRDVNNESGARMELQDGTTTRYFSRVRVEDPYVCNNLNVIFYLEGDRLLAHEQLTAFFPSSLLFGAPRIGIKINKEKVPLRAKKLLIFRTKSSHSNDYRFDKFGLVKEVDVSRENDVYFFDDVKDDDLDFSYDITSFYGKTSKVYSRFNYLLNERVWKFNFKEYYQPVSPRGKVDEITINYMLLDVNSEIDGGRCFEEDATLEYAIAYEDISGVISKAQKFEVEVEANKVVALYLLPEKFDESIKQLNIYRKHTDGEYRYIGSIDPEDGHIFVDNNIPAGKGNVLCDEPAEYQYEGGLRWSEPYRPDWYKEDSFVDYNSGDGTQGTGMTSLSGDLILFKENSMRRLTVQGADIPITRTDDITLDVGCIAPNALLNVNNIVFFLSRKGLMAFDNNIPQNIDTAFNEELTYRISNLGVLTRYISLGYNYHRNELYLNVPMLPVGENGYGWYGSKQFYRQVVYEDDVPNMVNYQRRIWGHIYVFNIDKKYYTKFAYQPDVSKKLGSATLSKEILNPLGNVRLYFIDTLNNLRSADIVQNLYKYKDGETEKTHKWAGIYIETPYNRQELSPLDGNTLLAVEYRDLDDILDLSRVLITEDFNAMDFPFYQQVPVKVFFKSKFISLDAETLLKRIRKVLCNIYSGGEFIIRHNYIHYEDIDDGIEYQQNLVATGANQFIYSPTINNWDYLNDRLVQGTGKSIVGYVPASYYEVNMAKGVKVSIEIEGYYRTKINSIELFVRPVYSYLK